jgi:hypothetical protein
MKFNSRRPHVAAANLPTRLISAFLIALCLAAGTDLLSELDRVIPTSIGKFSTIQRTSANSTYATLASGNLSFSVNAGNVNQISSNDNWSGVPSVEGYYGQGLTATHGVDPRTVLGTEFTGNALAQSGDTQVNANKGNPSAYNAGGVTEFDTGTFLAIGFQGNVQSNPYLVFYLNTTNRQNVTISYTVMDIDGGNNNAVTPLALQYRVGNSGLFSNLPGGYIADATQGPNISGLTNNISVQLPAAASNQPQVQVRVITTNAASTDGSSTPDEWVGVNNFVFSSVGPSAGEAELSGRVVDELGRGISGAEVTLLDELGIPRTVRTRAFGHYKFTNLSVGFSYIMWASNKRYVFDTHVVDLVDSVSDIDFVALGGSTHVPPQPDRGADVTSPPTAKSKY